MMARRRPSRPGSGSWADGGFPACRMASITCSVWRIRPGSWREATGGRRPVAVIAAMPWSASRPLIGQKNSAVQRALATPLAAGAGVAGAVLRFQFHDGDVGLAVGECTGPAVGLIVERDGDDGRKGGGAGWHVSEGLWEGDWLSHRGFFPYRMGCGDSMSGYRTSVPTSVGGVPAIGFSYRVV